MKFRSTIRVERTSWEYVKKIYPVYGAKNLSALIDGLLYFFCYAQNPPEVDIRRLLQDALDGKVYAHNPEVLAADQLRSNWLEFVEETHEQTMLELLCRDGDNFLAQDAHSRLRLNIQKQFAALHDYVLTDSELLQLFAVWRDVVKKNGKYREEYAKYNAHRLAKAAADAYED